MRGSGPGGDGHQGLIAWHQREANANQQGASVRLSNRVCPVGRGLYLRQTPGNTLRINLGGQQSNQMTLVGDWTVLTEEGDQLSMELGTGLHG